MSTASVYKVESSTERESVGSNRRDARVEARQLLRRLGVRSPASVAGRACACRGSVRFGWACVRLPRFRRLGGRSPASVGWACVRLPRFRRLGVRAPATVPSAGRALACLRRLGVRAPATVPSAGRSCACHGSVACVHLIGLGLA